MVRIILTLRLLIDDDVVVLYQVSSFYNKKRSRAQTQITIVVSSIQTVCLNIDL